MYIHLPCLTIQWIQSLSLVKYFASLSRPFFIHFHHITINSSRMGKPDFEAEVHIMLDLECTSVRHPNPAIIQLGAVHFDIYTGELLSTISISINLESCMELGLRTDDDTMGWLEKNIPETLEKSRRDVGGVVRGLKEALELFNRWLEGRRAWMRRDLTERRNGKYVHIGACMLMIWANGVYSDNKWMQHAYLACSMPMPWQHYQNRCVRTVVAETYRRTGVNFAEEKVMPFTGKKHNAVDDCKHQVRYMIKAMRAMDVAVREESAAPQAGMGQKLEKAVGDGDEQVESFEARILKLEASLAANSKAVLEQATSPQEPKPIFKVPDDQDFRLDDEPHSGSDTEEIEVSDDDEDPGVDSQVTSFSESLPPPPTNVPAFLRKRTSGVMEAG